MRHDPKLIDEEARLAALQRLAILDTGPEEPFDKVTDLVRNVLQVPIAAVTLVDRDRQWFKSIAGGPPGETPRNVSFCAHTIRQRGPMVVPDATLDARFSDNPLVTEDPGIRSYLGVPLRTPDGYNVGSLCAIDMQARAFTQSEIDLLTGFAGLVISELQLRQLAMSDHLTGAMSRRAWIDVARRELARCRRTGTEASIILFDIDHFKLINDTHGHQVGDQVLQGLTRLCLGVIRDQDFLGRLGGEEFAILLSSTDAVGAMELAERIREIFAGTPIDVAGTRLSVTASFGVSTLHDGIESVDDWLSEADARLYEAKAGGRNCCRGPDDPSLGTGSQREGSRGGASR
ncbi:MAG: sensor domain-containing diguanylate cyclase [Rubellimicrobium sp.]|nr:sensor domain-containing diguanylate cyclase [Rubellimicrobium sp.]